jgi:hypothetical protein
MTPGYPRAHIGPGDLRYEQQGGVECLTGALGWLQTVILSDKMPASWHLHSIRAS